jgi:hypothetical protein
MLEVTWQLPNTKHQYPNNNQSPNSKGETFWDIENWNLFEA